MMAVIVEADGSTGESSNVLVIDYDPGLPPDIPPDIDSISDMLVQEGKSLTATFSNIDSDVDSITATITSLPDAASFASFEVSNSAPGVYEVTLIFNPSIGDAGIYVFAVAADDGFYRSKEEFTLSVLAAEIKADEIILYLPVVNTP